jgi:hypothetical protein
MSSLLPATRADAAVLTAVVGARLGAVEYRYLPWGDPPEYTGGGAGVDIDLAAVVLELEERGRFTVTWAMTGPLEGLALLGTETPYPGLADEVIDATGREAWTRFQGQPITSVGLAWQVSGDGCPESVWAMRFDFPQGSVVVALGEPGPPIDYMPDELVVIFDEEVARAYRPPHVSESSWGQPPRPDPKSCG